MTTGILITLVLIAGILCLLACFAAQIAYESRKRRRYNEEWKAEAEAERRAFEAARKALKEYLSENETNTLAKIDNTVQNTSNEPEPPQQPAPTTPFLRNRDKLLAAKARLEETGSDNHGIPELGMLTHMDAWREVDAALLQLSEETNDG